MLKSLKWTVARHPLRSPAFLRLWLGLSISYVGDQFTTIALLWFVLQLTVSGVALQGVTPHSFPAHLKQESGYCTRSCPPVYMRRSVD